MTIAELALLQKQLEVDLPEWLTQRLLNYPQQLLAIARPDGSSISEFEFCNVYELLRDFNEEVRLEPIIDCHGFEFDWPDRFVAIGDNELGDYYFVDIDDPESPVMCLDSQLCEFFEVAENLDDYIDYLSGHYGNAAQSEEPVE